MEIPEALCCLFTAQLDQRDGSTVIEIPEQELHHGRLDDDKAYRIAIMPATDKRDAAKSESVNELEPAPQQPLVESGDTRVVEIVSLGNQGDGIARVDRDFVVIVPDTELGELVRVKITDVRENFAFADVVERLDSDD